MKRPYGPYPYLPVCLSIYPCYDQLWINRFYDSFSLRSIHVIFSGKLKKKFILFIQISIAMTVYGQM